MTDAIPTPSQLDANIGDQFLTCTRRYRRIAYGHANVPPPSFLFCSHLKRVWALDTLRTSSFQLRDAPPPRARLSSINKTKRTIHHPSSIIHNVQRPLRYIYIFTEQCIYTLHTRSFTQPYTYTPTTSSLPLKGQEDPIDCNSAQTGKRANDFRRSSSIHLARKQP
jgi:hypothetical protein